MTSTYKTQAAVLLLIHKRPLQTSMVMQAIREAQPSRLYVSADGPRDHVEGEQVLCDQALSESRKVDWNCLRQENVASKNLGCAKAVKRGIDWFFSQEPEGIILEDDCVPLRDFFRLCDFALERFRFDERIMMVSGTNVAGSWELPSHASYFYSSLGGIWGWATWRRAWSVHQGGYADFALATKNHLIRKNLSWIDGITRQGAIRRSRDHVMDTWAFPWALTRHVHRGLSIVPRTNLVDNVGFGKDASHTLRNPRIPAAQEMCDGTLVHNPLICPEQSYDRKFLRMTGPLRWIRSFAYEVIHGVLLRKT